MNIWFQGGGYACLWSFGVAQSFKDNNVNFNFTGGYSAGAIVSTFLCNPDVSTKDVLNSCIDGPYSPAKGRFVLFGRHERNLSYMGEACAGNPLDWHSGEYFNGKLWIPIRGLKSFRGTWRSKYRSYDDLIECIVSTGCIPLASGELSKCYYDDRGERRGPTVDGGFFTQQPPTAWSGKTIIVSPWGTGDINMNPKANFQDIITPSSSILIKYYLLGIESGKEYLLNRGLLK